MSDREKHDGKHARALLRMAQKELEALGGMQDPDVFADEIVGFHAQQAIEKILKAWMAVLSVEYPLTHDIEELLDLLEDEGCNVDPFWKLDRYTDFAVLFRCSSHREDLPGRATIVEEVRALFEHVRPIVAGEPPESHS